MHLSLAASRAASLALLSLSFLLPINAQSNTINQNITLRFFTTSQESSCDFGASTSAPTFTTSSIPLISHCFEISDLFTGNATQGFVNQTRNLDSRIHEEAGIHWALLNAETYSPQANHSSVLYRQHITNASNDDDKPGHYADRSITLYGGKGCTEKDPNNDKGLLNWYGFSCWSEEGGNCGTMGYNIASFSIQPEPKEGQNDGTCWVFAEMGAATHGYAGTQAAVMGAFVSASMAVWLAW